MALNYDAAEGVYTRFGRIYKEYVRTITAIGTALNTGVDDVYEEYASGDDALAIDNLFTLRESFRGAPASYLSGLVNVAQKSLISQVHRESPLAQQTLSAALTELIKLMKADSETVNRPTISATLTPYGSNYGDGTFVTAMVNGKGDPLDLVMDETINLKCTTDVGAGGTEYREVYTVTGEPTLSSTDYLWPGGSGATGTITLFDAGTQNDLISNGGFDTWTNSAAAPDSSWTAVTGTFGTNLTRSSSVKRGTYSLALTSDASTLLAVKQQLSTSIVKPNQVICFNAWMKSSASDATGIVTIKLVDGAGATLTNDAGTSQAYTREMDGQIGTSFTNITTTFQTPKVLPSTGVFLQIGYTTSPANAVVLTVDLVGLKVGTALYSGGPVTAGFSNATANAIGDYSSLVIASDATVNFMVKAFDRFFNMRSLGLYLPSATSETILDSLLTS
jgi:hypothetical protein